MSVKNMAWFGNINVSSSFLMHKKKASSGILVILTEELGAHVSVCVCVRLLSLVWTENRQSDELKLCGKPRY